jgi:hypothetical protein
MNKNTIMISQRTFLLSGEFLLVNFREAVDEGDGQHVGDQDRCHRVKEGNRYSHRSNSLHTLMVLQEDLHGLSTRDTVLPIVPMFHANAWGLAFSAPAVGAKLVMPGENLSPAVLAEIN